MKLTASILIITCMHVSAHSYSQTVSFSGKNVTLQAVFASIEKQTGLSFFFNLALMKDAKPVTLDLHEVTLEIALHEALKDQGLDFYKMGKTIFIIKRRVPSAVTDASTIVESGIARHMDVKGKVTNKQGESLVGATVAMKDGGKVTLTDERGMFELKNVPTGAILVITYLGYQKIELKVEVEGLVTIEMVVANNKLDEVQVIAYGNTTQRLNTGDVVIVKGEDISKQPVSNPLAALEGRVPGMVIQQQTGVPGGGFNIQIRGKNSLINGNDPLYIVDGVPFTSTLVKGVSASILGTSSNGNMGNPFSYINPSDIESVSVLKDADATAIYGSRGANGVVLITTRKGKSGKEVISMDVNAGFGMVGRKIKMLNSPQYLKLRNDAYVNDGIAPTSAIAPDLKLWDTTRYTDWVKTLIGGTAHYTNAQLSISGGNANVQYLIGGNYRRETTVFPTNLADQKGSVHFNISSISQDQRFKASLSGSYLSDNNRLIQNDLTNFINMSPDSPPVYNSDGSLNWAFNSSGASTFSNPMANLKQGFKNLTGNLIGNSTISYKLVKGLEIKASLGYNDVHSDQVTTIPLTFFNPTLWSIVQRTANFANTNIETWIVEPQILYEVNCLKGKISTLVGSTIQQSYSKGELFNATGYTSDLLLEDIKSAASVIVNSTVNVQYKYNAVFGRLLYNYNDKYLVNLTARRDGSSRFGPDNQFHNFGAFGAAWVFTKENIVMQSLNWLSFGKIRGSYGITGNDQIGDYGFLNLYGSTSIPYQGTQGLTVNNLYNPSLSWETNKKAEVGIDLGFLKDRIIFSGSYFLNRSSNQLVNYALPSQTGFTSIKNNLPALVQNTGVEAILSTINFASKYFSWNTSFNISFDRNKLVSFPNLATSTYASIYTEGQPLSNTKVYHVTGVDPQTGVYQFADIHGAPTFAPTTRTENVNTTPNYFGGVLNNFSYKGISIDIFFQFVKQIGTNYLYYSTAAPGMQLNQLTYVLDRWQNTGDLSLLQKSTQSSASAAGKAYGYIVSSDYSYSDASFIRLKNVAISYQIPQAIVSKAHLQSVKVYVQGQNLWTITKYKGYDPETQSKALPPLRAIVGGIQINL